MPPVAAWEKLFMKLEKNKYFKLFTYISVIILGGLLSNVSAQIDLSGNIPSGGIERKVFKKLLGLPHYGVFDYITFRIDGETVILNGKVSKPVNKNDAEEVVEDIKGVKKVVNNIEVLPLSSFDDTIRFRLLRTFIRRGSLFRYFQDPNPSIRLIVENGRVTMEGFVSNRGDFNLINILANGVPDVFNVKNNLVVEKELKR